MLSMRNTAKKGDCDLENKELKSEYKLTREALQELLVAMMADMIKTDARKNTAAEQRIRTNSIKFKKFAHKFRKFSIELEKRE